MNMELKIDAKDTLSIGPERLQEILEVAENICLGNFESRIKNIPTEEGIERALCIKINEMIDRSDAYLRESTACLGFIAENQYFRRIAPEGLLGSYGVAVEKINSAADGVERKILKFHDAVTAITTAAGQLNTSSQFMGDTVKSTSEKTAAVAAAAEEAGRNTQTVASAAEELNSSIQEINRQVTSSANMSSDAVTQSKEVNDMVASLSAASEEIGNVVKLINNIAGQTKLLALNATIEAARAGEAGKGFAVVASEVKSLSAETEKATEGIKQQVEAIQNAATTAVSSISEISKSISNINEVSSAIASAVEEQGAATQEISRNVQEAASGVQDVTTNVGVVNENVKEVSASSEQLVSVASELNHQAELLTEVLNSK